MISHARTRPMLSDGAVAAVTFLLTLALLAGARGSGRGLDSLGVLLAAVSTFPLVARRRSPIFVFALTALASASLNGLGYALGPPFGPTVALFFVATDGRTHARVARTAAVVVAVFAVHVAATATAESGFPTTAVLFGILVWGGALTIGDQLRQRRLRRLDVEERLRRAEQESARERRLATAEERTRIARDLHDSAAHAINVILVQAGAARLLQERDPEVVRTALTTIEDVARETIGEIDLLVRGLREDVVGTVEPPVGLAALGTLVERHRAAGLMIELTVDGRARPLSRGVDQAAYRVLQESLTNAARHGAGSAVIAVRYGDDHLELTITNPLLTTKTAGDTGGGHGILGMEERALLLGGALDARREGDAFRVHARLPYAGGEEAA